jgi:hypothetical protein
MIRSIYGLALARDDAAEDRLDLITALTERRDEELTVLMRRDEACRDKFPCLLHPFEQLSEPCRDLVVRQV